jgi:soluble lytic murein transglycosylase-like protein/LAS superfamily LD-carboxypeptidase LdcB
MSVLQALREHFLLPAGATQVAAAPTAVPRDAGGPPRASAVAVLCRERDAAVMAASVGADLARQEGARAVLVCVWGGRVPGSRLPGTGAARRLARSLAARGQVATASGRLVFTQAADAAAAGRALGAAPGPSVLVVAGPRDERLDALLRAQDRVVVAEAGEEGVAQLACARLASEGVAATRCSVPTGAARRVALLGAHVPPAVRASLAAERGQATILLVALLLALVLGALLLGGIARGVGAAGERQRAADLAALAGARAMHGAFDRLFEPATVAGRPNPRHLELPEYLRLARAAAVATARRNGFEQARVAFPDGASIAPVRIRVTVRDPIQAGDEELPVALVAEAELAPPAAATVTTAVGAGEYRGPLETRQGKPMRPDVALAFDRMEAAARADGVALSITSGWRSNAEQAALFARHPDPKWVAPPGKSLHRLGTELDLGPPAAYGWLARNATRFGFVQRYSWEPWHYGYTRSPGSTSVGFGGGGGGDGERTGTLQSFVPARYAPMITRAAQRWSVSGALLAAQIYAESRFNPFARSPAGAQGIAQFMPGTAQAYGLDDPFDAEQAIDAQARMMRDLLRRFASVPLALAAYNAGPAPVAACGCIPPYPETRGYVARILGLLNGAGDLTLADPGLAVRLVR